MSFRTERPETRMSVSLQAVAYQSTILILGAASVLRLTGIGH